MSFRTFGVKVSGYTFTMGKNGGGGLTEISAKELKDGSWTFIKHSYRDIKELDMCMASAIIFLMECNILTFSTIGIKKDMPMVEYIMGYGEKRTSKRIYMSPNTHRDISNDISKKMMKEGDSSFLTDDVKDYFIKRLSASDGYTISIEPSEARDAIFGEIRFDGVEVEEDDIQDD